MHLDAALPDAGLALRPLDLALARFLRDQAGETDECVLLAVALASRQLGLGHACLLLRELPVSDDLPTAASWQARLARSPVIADIQHDPGNQDAPLVLADDRLYLRRAWRDEQIVAAGIRRRLGCSVETPEAWHDDLVALFPERSVGPDWQQVACAAAASSRFAVITGGPGTGKTTTVLKLLALLQQRALAAGQPLRIRLAAPTGKAAARLNESLREQLDRLPVGATVKAAIPLEVVTVHRLLGMHPELRQFRHGPHHPLPVDVLVVDEASMLDLEMTAALIRALPDEARLILLGDRDQLASVEAGAILGDLCAGAMAGGYAAARADWLQRVTGQDIQAWCAPAGHPVQAIDQQVVMLRRSHRFDPDRGIGRLASALRDGEGAAPGLLAGCAPEVSLVDLDALVAGHDALALAVRQLPANPDDASAWQAWALDCLQVADRYRLLCAVREGAQGVAALNDAVSARWRQLGWRDDDAPWHAGRMVMIRRNDPALGLMNGDVGLVLPKPDPVRPGRLHLRVAFRTGPDTLRWLMPARLPPHETAFAMTVHKSQGSEFHAVGFVLPDRPLPVLTRELLYTAVTRARQRCLITLPDPGVWALAANARAERHAGLRQALSGDSSSSGL